MATLCSTRSSLKSESPNSRASTHQSESQASYLVLLGHRKSLLWSTPNSESSLESLTLATSTSEFGHSLLGTVKQPSKVAHILPKASHRLANHRPRPFCSPWKHPLPVRPVRILRFGSKVTSHFWEEYFLFHLTTRSTRLSKQWTQAKGAAF